MVEEIQLTEETKDFIRDLFSQLDHRIALGIRKGLFGSSATNDANIDNTVSVLNDCLYDIGANGLKIIKEKE